MMLLKRLEKKWQCDVPISVDGTERAGGGLWLGLWLDSGTSLRGHPVVLQTTDG